MIVDPVISYQQAHFIINKMDEEYLKIIAEHEQAKRISQQKIGEKLKRNEEISGQLTSELSNSLNFQVRKMHQNQQEID